MYLFSLQKCVVPKGYAGRSIDGWDGKAIISDPGTSRESGQVRVEPCCNTEVLVVSLSPILT